MEVPRFWSAAKNVTAWMVKVILNHLQLPVLNEPISLKQFRAVNSGEKSVDDMMHTYTEDLTDQDLQDLAPYWAAQKKNKALLY